MRTVTIRSASLVILGLAMLLGTPSLAATPAQFGVAVVVTVPPPDLPVYDQPPCPGDSYMWVPGYWAWDADFDDYFWVPGTWVLAPQVGFFWTPGYWSWSGASFVWINGYWGPVVGFYGGVNYGFGYFGNGYVGGHWDHDRFYYNRSVTNVNETIVHNVYNTTVVNNNTTVNRVSYNGGTGGLIARPTAEQEAAEHERHVAPVAAQRQQMQDARSNRQLWASVNHGQPPIAATQKPAQFKGGNVVAAKEAGTVHNNPAAPENRVNPNRGVQPSRNAPTERAPAPNERPNQTYQQQQQQRNQENMRMNEQQSKQERKQQQKEQQRMQQQREQETQMRNRPPEEPPAATGRERPQAPQHEERQRQEQRQQAPPQPEGRSDQRSDHESHGKKPEQQ